MAIDHTEFKKVKWLFGRKIEIPWTWKIKQLRVLSSRKPEYGSVDAAIPYDPKLPRYIRITDIDDDGGLKDERVSVKLHKNQEKILEDGDFLFARTGSVGRTFLFSENHGPCVFAGYLIRFKLIKQQILPEFLFYYTHSPNYWVWLKSELTQGVQPNVNAQQYSKLPIMLPPLPEQKGIASILSNVDALITSARDVIEKTERFKRGLMQELLSKGIGHTEFTKVKWPFGNEIMIPEKWKIQKLNNVGKFIGGGTPKSSNRNYWCGEIPWAVPTDITRLISIFINDTERKITRRGLDNSAATLLPIGSVLITSRATIGKCAINREVMATNQGFQNLICNQNNYNLFWFYAITFHQRQLMRVAQGTTFLEIGKNAMKNISMPTPPLLEQKKIASTLSGIDAYVQNMECVLCVVVLLYIFIIDVYAQFLHPTHLSTIWI